MPNRIRYIISRMSCHCRVRHWHGRGIHSPTAYRFTREVFCRRRHLPQQGELFSLLRESGFDRSVSRMAQAVCEHFDCRSFRVLQATADGNNTYAAGKTAAQVTENTAARAAENTAVRAADGAEMYLMPPGTTAGTLNAVLARNGEKRTVICLLSPRSTINWYNTCLMSVRRHESMSIDCRSMIILLNNFKRINHQHIKL